MCIYLQLSWCSSGCIFRVVVLLGGEHLKALPSCSRFSDQPLYKVPVEEKLVLYMMLPPPPHSQLIRLMCSVSFPLNICFCLYAKKKICGLIWTWDRLHICLFIIMLCSYFWMGLILAFFFTKAPLPLCTRNSYQNLCSSSRVLTQLLISLPGLPGLEDGHVLIGLELSHSFPFWIIN